MSASRSAATWWNSLNCKRMEAASQDSVMPMRRDGVTGGWSRLATVVVLLTSVAAAQDTQREAYEPLPDSLARRNVASILFERNLNTFNWTGAVIVDTNSFGSRIRLNELFTSNIILLEGTPAQRLRSDHQRLALSVNHPVNNELSVAGEWLSSIYSDKKSVGLSTTASNSVLGGIEYLPNEFLALSPMIGHRWDNQAGARDKGLTYELGARLNPLDLDGYHFEGNAQFHQDRLDPRLLEQHFAHLKTEKTFIGRTRDSLDIGFTRNRREFYAFSSGTMESRIENAFSFANLLNYEFSSSFATALFVNVYSRVLDKDFRSLTAMPTQFNTGIDEFRLDASIDATYQDEETGMLATTRFTRSERSEKHFIKAPTAGARERLAQDQETRKDNFAVRTALSALLDFPFTRSDRALLSGAASILRYDTPADSNFEDRDELLVVFSLSTMHAVSRALDLSFTLDGTLNHIVYLFSERSANNNINRVLRFAPRTLFRPFTNFTSMNAFEVLANYTVYDFEDRATQVRSFSYRQFGWMDSTSLDLSRTLGLDFFAYLKLYDRGQLNWSEFSERRENSFIDKTYALQARFMPEAGLLFAVGVRYFSQTRYTYVGQDRKLDSFVRSVGPTCLIVWQLSRRSEVGIKGWYEQRRLGDGSSKSLTNMTMNINITL
ncbi:MAG: hypothetical protein HY961_10490 [Ignavibacteriae bacterium]|nr:hypothetical protein [Ignavibacteriota bacterium]